MFAVLITNAKIKPRTCGVLFAAIGRREFKPSYNETNLSKAYELRDALLLLPPPLSLRLTPLRINHIAVVKQKTLNSLAKDFIYQLAFALAQATSQTVVAIESTTTDRLAPFERSRRSRFFVVYKTSQSVRNRHTNNACCCASCCCASSNCCCCCCSASAGLTPPSNDGCCCCCAPNVNPVPSL
jgi:hypothetical protein